MYICPEDRGQHDRQLPNRKGRLKISEVNRHENMLLSVALYSLLDEVHVPYTRQNASLLCDPKRAPRMDCITFSVFMVH